MSFRNRIVVTALFVASSVPLIAQAKQPEVTLSDDLNHSYSFTTKKTAGAIYTVHISGLSEQPSNEDEPTFTLTPSAAPKSDTSIVDVFTDRHGTHEVQPGDQFYLTTIDVNKHFLTFHLLSVDRHTVITKGDSDRVTFNLALKFPLQPGVITTLTAAGVHQMVDSVLSLAPTGATALQPGQTEAEVKEILGQPDQEVDLPSKHITVFKAVKVVFVDGKVTDIQ
jgi:hypothetical protein